MKKRLFQVLFLFLLVLMLPFSQKIGEKQVWAAEEETPSYPANEAYTLNTITDGVKISTKSDGEKPTVLIFSGVGCSRTKRTIASIAASSLITAEDARIIFAECQAASLEEVRTYADTTGNGSDKITYCYDSEMNLNNNILMKVMSRYLEISGEDPYSASTPVIVLIDKNDKIRQLTKGQEMTAEALKDKIDSFINTENPDPENTVTPTLTPLPGLGDDPYYTFQTINGDRISTTYMDTPKKNTVLLFGKTNCGKTKATIQEINKSTRINEANHIRVIFAESTGKTLDETKIFANSYNKNPITFCYDDGNTGLDSTYNAMFRYARFNPEIGNAVSFPLTVLIDENNRVRKVMQGFQTEECLWSEICQFTTPSNPDATPPEVPAVTPIPNPVSGRGLPSISGNTVSVNSSSEQTTMLIFGTVVSDQTENPEARSMASEDFSNGNSDTEVPGAENSTDVDNTLQTLRNIRGSDLYKKDMIHVIFAECNKVSEAVLLRYIEEFKDEPNMEFCYAEDVGDKRIQQAMEDCAGVFNLPVGSLTLPFTVLINQENQVQNVLEGPLKTEEIETEINGEPIPPEDPTPTESPEPTEPVNTLEPTGSPGTINTPLPTDTPEPTDTPIPTDTPMPTDTPIPTDTPDPTVSPAPVSVSKVSGLKNVSGKNSIKLNWNKISGADGYIIYQYKNSGWKQIASMKSGKNAYTVKKLKAGANYRFAIKAYIMQDQKQTLSKSYTSVYAATKPADPAVKATAKRGKVTLSWKKVTGATGYQIRYKTSKNGSWKTLKTTKKTSFSSKELKYGKTYWFKVNAYKNYKGKTYTGTGETKKVTVK